MHNPPPTSFTAPRLAWLGVLGALLASVAATADEPEARPPPDEPPGLVRLTKDYDLWVDLKRKLVVVDGEVALREGTLEMFACPRKTKEHESIVAVNCKAQFIHTALIAVGAVPGKPVSFDPRYAPATGTEIDVFVLWRSADGRKHQVRAQQWVRFARSGRPMTYHWVFAGSGFWVDETTGDRYYHADAGDFICVSNFPTAMLDMPVESSQANSDLLFEAFTERIPPRGTKVRLILAPKPGTFRAADGQKEECRLPARNERRGG
jgi:hypothetical protein